MCPDPAQEEEPENAGQDEEADSRENPSLNELPEPRDHEANQRGDYDSRRTLSHAEMIRRRQYRRSATRDVLFSRYVTTKSDATPEIEQVFETGSIPEAEALFKAAND